MDVERLNFLLRKFYFAARTTSGKRYSRSAYKNLRLGIQRHLQSEPYNREFSIVKDSAFKGANKVFDGYLSALREEGGDTTQHKEEIEPEDVQRLYDIVFDDTPRGLQMRVFYELCYHFGRRGREGLRLLHRNSFKVFKDANGQEYVGKQYHEKEKAKPGTGKQNKEKEPYMYSLPGDKNCPVTHYKRYIELLNPQCDALFQRAKIVGPKVGPWYENSPLGYHQLADMMKTMSKLGGLSKTYTNHCIRKTTVTALDNAGFEAKDIMSVTGHTNVASLDPYLGRPSMQKKKRMSDALSEYHKTSTAPGTSNARHTEPTPSTSSSGPEVLQQSSTTENVVPSTSAAHDVVPSTSTAHDVDPCPSAMSEVDIGHERHQVDVLQSSQTSEDGVSSSMTSMRMVQQSAPSLFAGAVLNHCTINISVQK